VSGSVSLSEELPPQPLEHAEAARLVAALDWYHTIDLG
jgi:hypothetical protein